MPRHNHATCTKRAERADIAHDYMRPAVAADYVGMSQSTLGQASDAPQPPARTGFREAGRLRRLSARRSRRVDGSQPGRDRDLTVID